MGKRDAIAGLIILTFIGVFIAIWMLQMHSAFSDKMLLDNMQNECPDGLVLLNKKVTIVSDGATTTEPVVGCFPPDSTAIKVR